ncbi:UDP-N-acetylenolpyruvoylglucosamine reductase [Marinobacter nitratireducens]|uniref:UDP-N-acetylenolpyruvoylglucosamine reductase n=1 Tax=Marinobacter nitratireducens TaxID=1137280 RepID=A0A072N3B3_9GAMM|nr:UDP-N-acetylmuramate dehydrogenase [Marinobacter nitratireducens]KEF32164.1 UDP-N-acetylenolpyruvoylglucosamine reductase [Marinobacter nitratireducens]
MSIELAIQSGVELEEFNTLHLPSIAKYYLEVTDSQTLLRALHWADENRLQVLILGGGSNLVFSGDFEGLVIRISIRGRSWEQAANSEATLVLGAGESWHDAVLYAARSGYRGIENLALIPGTAGAAPVQNIGAYGVELQDTLASVTAYDREEGGWVTLNKEQCGFAYRDSVFKRNPGRFIITELRLKLSRDRALQTGYRDLQEYLGDPLPDKLEAIDVVEAVMAIRRRKLPDPEILPNAGSFFKNPVVPNEVYEGLRNQFDGIVGYAQPDCVKLAAAWLIDQCGWKGFRNETVGVHNRQALVLINHSGGSGRDILALADRIRQSVCERFGVELEMEPGIVGSGCSSEIG